MNTRKGSMVFSLALIVTAAVMVGGCRDKSAGSKASSAKAINMAEAKKIYDTRCVACHGKNGRGDGPGAKGLKPPPRDYSDAKWQASVTDRQLSDTILKGGMAVGKSALMPGNPDLKGKDAVLNGLVKIVRGFKK